MGQIGIAAHKLYEGFEIPFKLKVLLVKVALEYALGAIPSLTIGHARGPRPTFEPKNRDKGAKDKFGSMSKDKSVPSTDLLLLGWHLAGWRDAYGLNLSSTNFLIRLKIFTWAKVSRLGFGRVGGFVQNFLVWMRGTSSLVHVVMAHYKGSIKM